MGKEKGIEWDHVTIIKLKKISTRGEVQVLRHEFVEGAPRIREDSIKENPMLGAIVPLMTHSCREKGEGYQVVSWTTSGTPRGRVSSSSRSSSRGGSGHHAA